MTAPDSRSEADAPVVLIGGQARMVLAVASSLGRRGIAVVHAPMGAVEDRMPSRHVRETLSIRRWLGTPEGFVAAVEAIAARWPGALLIPLNDSALVGLAGVRDRARFPVTIGCPAAEVVARTIDKTETARVAARLGIPVPRTFALPDAGAVEVQAARLTFPLFFKARDKIDHGRRHGGTDFGVGRHPDLAALRAAFVADPAHGREYLFQEYCPGHDVLLSLLLHEGRVLAAFQARSLRTWPSTGGVTVLTRSEPVDPVLREQLAALLREIGWEGLAQADFRRDPATGRTVLLEINGRFWGSTFAAVQAGIDFPYYVWQLARGETPEPPANYRAGRMTHWAMGDLKRLLRLWRHPAAGESRGRELARFLSAFRPSVGGMMWRWDDPRPAWSEWSGDLRWFVLGAARRLWRRMTGGKNST